MQAARNGKISISRQKGLCPQRSGGTRCWKADLHAASRETRHHSELLLSVYPPMFLRAAAGLSRRARPGAAPFTRQKRAMHLSPRELDHLRLAQALPPLELHSTRRGERRLGVPESSERQRRGGEAVILSGRPVGQQRRRLERLVVDERERVEEGRLDDGAGDG